MKVEQENKKILLVGATGFLGRKILADLLTKPNISIRAMSRKSPTAVENNSVEWVKADLMDSNSLDEALKGIDIVISSANGYMKESIQTDYIGNKNLIEASQKAKIKRFIFLSIVSCELAFDVPHFHAKKISEDLLISSGLPYVSVRAPAFLDQESDYIADAVKKGKFYGVGDKTTKWSYVYTEDLASYLSKAALYPDDSILNKVIDVGWQDGPKSQEELKNTIGEITGKKLSIMIIPWFILKLFIFPVKIFSELGYDFIMMFLFFKKGKFLSDIKLQEKFFGNAPTSQEVIKRWAMKNQLI